jgi:hypothetical protein
MPKFSWPVPWSVPRLVERCRTWSFHGDVDDLPDEEDGTPQLAAAYRRLTETLPERQDAQGEAHGTKYELWFDDTEMPFRISDVAIIIDECRRLNRLERKIIHALGPPTQTIDPLTGQVEEDES